MDAIETELLKQYKLTLISDALEALRDIDPTLSITSSLHLIHIIKAGDNGITPSNLARVTETELPTVSRQLTNMKEHGREGKAGLGLIKFVENHKDRRYKPALLTDKGEELKTHLMNL